MGKAKQLIQSSLKNHMLLYNAVSVIISKMGYADVNLAGQNARYRAFKYLKKHYGKYIGKSQFKSYEGDSEEKIWVCWLQGIENAPDIVTNCYASMKHYLDKEITVITKDNVREYATLPDYIYDKWEKGIITNTHFSDIVRLQILIEHGGLWIDATTYFTGRLPGYITDNDFFVYHDGFFDCETINMGSWIIHSKPNNILLQETQNLLLTYWKKKNYLKQYFLLHLFFRMVTDYYSDEWAKVPYYSQMNQHILMFELKDSYDEKRWKQIKEMSDIHKLTTKINAHGAEDNSYLSMLDRLYK